MRKISITIFAFFILVYLTGCAFSQSSNNSMKGSSLKKKTNSQPVEAKWTLTVNDTIEKKTQGIPFKYTLKLNAVKMGGETDLGKYTGTAILEEKMDFEKQPELGALVKGGVGGVSRDTSVVLNLVKFNRDRYDSFGLKSGEHLLSGFTEPDSMGLGVFSMKGEGYMDVKVSGIPNVKGQLKNEASASFNISYKINIEGGQVDVSIPSLNLDESFKGMVTGEPLK